VGGSQLPEDVIDEPLKTSIKMVFKLVELGRGDAKIRGARAEAEAARARAVVGDANENLATKTWAQGFWFSAVVAIDDGRVA
jgi:hypothetical protein